MKIEMYSDLSVLWNTSYFHNTIGNYVFAFGIFLGSAVFLSVVRHFVITYLARVAEKTKSDIDDLFLHLLLKMHASFYLAIALFIGLQFLTINANFYEFLKDIFIIFITIQVILFLQIVFDFALKRYLARKKDESVHHAVSTVAKLGKIALWVFGIFLILSNVGINVTSLLAGLGIGGIAIALALQNILSDLFSSFAIYFDKPFVVGDFIIVGDKMGVVEKIGIKTTRIRALQGEEIVISNQELTSARIQNFKKMQNRRVVFAFGVIYETPQAKLKKIPEMVKKIIEKVKETKFDRAHFHKFDDSALSFEVVYYVNGGDYNLYMDIHQEILFALREIFLKENIAMAYPTQTIYLAKE